MPKHNLVPGTYQLAVAVKNPKADRRKTRDWTAAPEFEPGAYLYVDNRLKLVGSRVGSVGEWSHAEQFMALAEHLSPIAESVDAMFTRLGVSSMAMDRFCRHLIDTGVLTPAQFEHYFNEWNTDADED